MLAHIGVADAMAYLHGRPYGLRQHIVEDGVLAPVVQGLAHGDAAVHTQRSHRSAFTIADPPEAAVVALKIGAPLLLTVVAIVHPKGADLHMTA